MTRTSLLIEISVMGFFFVAISTELNVLKRIERVLNAIEALLSAIEAPSIVF